MHTHTLTHMCAHMHTDSSMHTHMYTFTYKYVFLDDSLAMVCPCDQHRSCPTPMERHHCPSESLLSHRRQFTAWAGRTPYASCSAFLCTILPTLRLLPEQEELSVQRTMLQNLVILISLLIRKCAEDENSMATKDFHQIWWEKVAA